jgi:hypothetical protein
MSEQNPPATPRAFLSYSWSSPQHETWVVNLANRLVEDGVDIKLDKWDLKPGHDSYKFMESMVTDPNVTKVLMICDKVYTDKADTRTGGVGAESQIISPELYGKGSQDKFAALITETNDEGDGYVPVFYKGRIHFDFSSTERFEESYEQLLRWLVDRPQYIKPKLGSIPISILQVAPVANATLSRAKRAEEAVRRSAPGGAALIREYGEAFISEIRLSAPELDNSIPFDENMLATVDTARPYLRQLAELVTVIVRYGSDERLWDEILTIHERLGTLMFRPPEIMQFSDTDWDAFKIIAHDAFLTTIAITLTEKRFDLADMALRRAWLVDPTQTGHGPVTSKFTVFNQHVATLESRNSRLRLSRASLHADLIKQAHPNGGSPSFEAIMQADFVLYLNAPTGGFRKIWLPFTLVHAGYGHGPFELFARAESKAFFSSLSQLLDVASVETFKEKITRIEADEQTFRMFSFHGFPVGRFANNEHIGSIP